MAPSGVYIPQGNIYIKRNTFSHLLKALNYREITVIVGSRQVGKTFLMKKLIEKLLAEGNVDPKQIFYFNFDAFILIDLVNNARNFLDFLQYYGLNGKNSYIFLMKLNEYLKWVFESNDIMILVLI